VHSTVHQLNTVVIKALLIVECYNVKHLEGELEVFSLCAHMLCSCSTAYFPKCHEIKVVVGLVVRPDHNQEHCYHHAPTVKPEAATAVVELLMMGGRTSETC
jgi:hypothetical protein